MSNFSPIGSHKDVEMRPSSATTLQIEENSAHSTAWWWNKAAGNSLHHDKL